MYSDIKKHLQQELEDIKEAGLYKSERIITSSQDAEITISTGEKVINFLQITIWVCQIILK